MFCEFTHCSLNSMLCVLLNQKKNSYCFLKLILRTLREPFYSLFSKFNAFYVLSIFSEKKKKKKKKNQMHSYNFLEKKTIFKNHNKAQSGRGRLGLESMVVVGVRESFRIQVGWGGGLGVLVCLPSPYPYPNS